LKIDAILKEMAGRAGAMIEAVAKALLKGHRFLVTSHRNPDGDAIGSMFAMACLLEDNDREAVLFHADPVPGPYRFLPGTDRLILDPSEVSGDFDGVVVLDVGERERIAEILPPSAEEGPFIVIDHHMKHHGDLGDVVWRQPASAVGEMLVELVRHLHWRVSEGFAECAYTAILSDTGSFRYSSTTAEALEAASWLVSKGVQPWKVASHVYETWPLSRLLLLGDVLSTLSIHCDGRLASMVVSQDALARRGATVDMTEGFVNHGRMVAGVEASVLLRERAPDLYRLSFRSRGRVDVSEVASKLGGGGHRNASGATTSGSLDDVRARLEELFAEALQQAELEDRDSCWSRH
jgi:phosphoesterase RecJ-like protein